MGVIPAILRRGFVGEHLVIGHVVPIHIVARSSNDRWAGAQVAKQSAHGDIDYVIAKATAIGPTAGNCSPAEAGLDGARQYVPAKDTEA